MNRKEGRPCTLAKDKISGSIFLNTAVGRTAPNFCLSYLDRVDMVVHTVRLADSAGISASVQCGKQPDLQHKKERSRSMFKLALGYARYV